MNELKASFPAGIDYSIPFDTTKFIKVSIEEVIHTFIEAIILILIAVGLLFEVVFPWVSTETR